ncbi:Txe/YoeB family addiction module toxin [Lactobacillus johnsonii]|uniref:Endoribonuclease YoeB n=1 Tax=Lactobacillus johnsonii TaxID=33959 RepID=A0A9X4XCH9_LACJH|nr:Txe/YoeB family addiction module toxin [Lactobacillus johnsonii]
MSKKIDKLIKDTIRHPFEGLGKPEPLRESLTGYWSRQITKKDRMVYSVTSTEIRILQLKYHYTK